MSNEEPVSAFRSALTAASGHIIGSAFPQLGAMMDRMRDQDNKKDRDKASKASKSSSGDRKGSLSSSAIQVIDEGFDELHGDLQVTNIILNSSLEEHRRISGLLEKMLLSGGGGGGGLLGGGGGGGGGVVDTAAGIGIWELGKKLLGGLTRFGGPLAALTALSVADAKLADPTASPNEHKYGPIGIPADDYNHFVDMAKAIKESSGSEQTNLAIAALTKQIDNLNETIKQMRKDGQDTTATEGIKNELEQRLKDKKEANESIKNTSGEDDYKDFIDRHPPALSREIANIALPQSPDNRSNPNPLQPTFDDQGVDAANSRLTPGVADIKRKMSGQPTVKYGDESKSSEVASGSVTSSLFGGESGGNYGIYNKGPQGLSGVGHADLGSMTIAQVMEEQSKHNMFAVGAYQMIPKTLAAGVEHLKLDPNQKFDKATQDKLYTEWLAGDKRPQIRDFIMGKSDDLGAAHLATAQEWASVAYHGRSYYPNDRASISDEKIEDSLKKARDIYQKTGNYKAALDGILPKDAESESGKKQALLAAGTNDWGDSNKSYAGVKNSLQALKDKGYDPILVLPNKSVHGSGAAYDGALKAATELGVKTEYPSSFETGSESYHIAPKGVAEIKAKYPGVPAFGDSNGDRLGATEGITGFQGKGAEEIAGHLKNIAAVAVKQDQRVVDSPNFRPVNDQAFRKIANYIDSKNITAGFKDGPLNVNNRLDSPALDFSSYQPDNLAPYIQQTGIDNAAKTVSNRGSNSVKALFTDHTNKSGSPDERSHKDKNNAGSVAPPDERLKKLFDNYIVGTHR